MKCKTCGKESDTVNVRIVRVTEYRLCVPKNGYTTTGITDERLGEPIYYCDCGEVFTGEDVETLDAAFKR